MTDDARKRQDAGRDRRYSEDRAKRTWYAFHRAVRFRRRYFGVGVEVEGLVVAFRKCP